MDVEIESSNGSDVEKIRRSNIPNAKTQDAMRDADAWMIAMRAKESQRSQSNIGTLVKYACSYQEFLTPKI
jgi:hypothetical protein